MGCAHRRRRYRRRAPRKPRPDAPPPAGGRLREVFDALGVRLTVRFGPNTGTGRRHRVPLGGVLLLGATPIAPVALDNETPSAGAEGVAYSRNTRVVAGDGFEPPTFGL